MAIKRPKPEEIVVKLRQVEVLMGQGLPRIDAIRQIGVPERPSSGAPNFCQSVLKIRQIRG